MNIRSALTNLNGNTPNIIGAAVIRIDDGSIISSVIQKKFDEDLIGCLTASMMGIGERIAAELMNSEVDRLYVQSPNGYVIVNEIGKDNALIVLTTENVRLGLIFFEIKKTINEIEQMKSNSL